MTLVVKPKPDRSRKRAKNIPCFVAEFSIGYSPKQRKKARARLNVGTIFYNACLREAFDRAERMRADARWIAARAMPKTVNKKPNTPRKDLFDGARKDAGFSQYSMHIYSTSLRVGALRDVLSHEAQVLAA